MLKANTKTLFHLLSLLTALLIISCSNPEKERLEQLSEASTLTASGQYSAALAILESLLAQYPNDSEVILELANVYSLEGNPTIAAFYLEQAYRLDPENIELLYQAYRQQEKAGNPEAAKTLLITLSEKDPSAMTPELWTRLGQLQAENKNYEAALKAYLKGVDPDKAVPNAETAAAIGDLFIKLDNLPMAERWLTIAAESNDPSAFTALFGLLEINLRNKNWTAAEANIKQLDAQFPGALDVSQWASARDELAKWRAAQKKMQTDLAAAAAAKEAQTTQAVAIDSTEVIEVPDQSDEATTEVAADTEGKAQIVEDMENMVALADTPAVEAETPANVAFNPNIAVQPADPDFNVSVTFDQQALGAQANIRTETSDAPAPAFTPTPAPAPRPVTNIKSVEELLIDADTASQSLDYKAAIRNYWQALGRSNNRPDIWNMLSKAYLADGQNRNAETAALEATRLAPSEIEYTLDYLRVVQRTKNATNFIAELETAYSRFPRSPEITLSLARAYDRLNSNSVAAANYYNRFIEIAPNHPLRSEAESALNRL